MGVVRNDYSFCFSIKNIFNIVLKSENFATNKSRNWLLTTPWCHNIESSLPSRTKTVSEHRTHKTYAHKWLWTFNCSPETVTIKFVLFSVRQMRKNVEKQRNWSVHFHFPKKKNRRKQHITYSDLCAYAVRTCILHEFYIETEYVGNIATINQNMYYVHP